MGTFISGFIFWYGSPVFGKILAWDKNTGSAGQNPVFSKNQADF
jgi:hypothetical protein